MSTTESTNGGTHAVLQLDAIIIGAGFSGIYLLHKIRDELQMNVKIFESQSDIGGVWEANRYPGVRVDCPMPLYAYSSQKLWEPWTWKQTYPERQELKTYFDHVDRVLDVRKDCFFNSEVNSATYDPTSGKWKVQTVNGHVATAKYLIVAVGSSSKSYIPDWEGLSSFQGPIYHSAHWPEEGVDVKGKKVAVVGTGASGVQITQEWAKEAKETFVFQRTPNLCLPMRQKDLDAAQQEKEKLSYQDYLTRCSSTFAGLEYEMTPRNTFDDSPAEREALYEELYKQGGFRFWFNNYQDMIFDLAANREAYNFWARKTRARISDPKKRDLLAPLEPPHPFGAKRPSLEQDFYEQFNKPNVHIVDTKTHPIIKVTTAGIVTADNQLHEVDIIAVATGFDSITGGLLRLGLKDINGTDLAERWKDGMSTYLGVSISGFPNMFLPYSLQAPSAFANGPTIIEFQGNWIAAVIQKMETEGVRSITPTTEAESSWNAEVNDFAEKTLLPLANSWYMGSNIPGKPVQSLNYIGGLENYRNRCARVLNEDFFGFAKA